MDEQFKRDDYLREQQQLIHDGFIVDNPTWGRWFNNWRHSGQVNSRFKETDEERFAEITKLFYRRYENASNPVNIPLKNTIRMKQEAYETKKDNYLGITFAPKSYYK